MTAPRGQGRGTRPASDPGPSGGGAAWLEELSFSAVQHIIRPPDPIGRGLCTRDDFREMGFRSGDCLVAFSTGAGEGSFVLTSRRPW